MDYDNPQFIAAVKKILRGEKENPTVEPQSDPGVQDELSKIRVDISSTSIDQIKANSPQERRHDWWKDFIEIAGIGVIALYTLFAYLQWHALNTANIEQSGINTDATARAMHTEMEIRKNAADTHALAVEAGKQAEAALKQSSATDSIAKASQIQARANLDTAAAAKASADTAVKELELSERPWVDASFSLDGPLSFNVNGANITLKIDLRNTGHSPALSTTISPLTLIGRNGNNAASYREKVCQDATRMVSTFPRFGVALFPNITLEQKETVTFNSQDIADIPKDQFASHFPGNIISPAVVLCIGYRPTFTATSIYHTAYILDVFKRQADGTPSDKFKIGEDVDNTHLFLRLHFLDAISAD
jgi:hypothetical protein